MEAIGCRSYDQHGPTAVSPRERGMGKTPMPNRLMLALSTLGELGVIWFLLLGTMGIFDKKTRCKVALVGLVVLTLGFALSELIKELTMRPRRFLSLSDVGLLVSSPHSYAFPSGHTTSALATISGVILTTKRLLGGRRSGVGRW